MTQQQLDTANALQQEKQILLEEKERVNRDLATLKKAEEKGHDPEYYKLRLYYLIKPQSYHDSAPREMLDKHLIIPIGLLLTSYLVNIETRLNAIETEFNNL